MQMEDFFSQRQHDDLLWQLSTPLQCVLIKLPRLGRKNTRNEDISDQKKYFTVILLDYPSRLSNYFKQYYQSLN